MSNSERRSMTIPPETERGYGKPREEIANVIEGYQSYLPMLSTRLSEVQRAKAARQYGNVMADKILSCLRSKGWLSDLGITAIEAERMEK